MTTPGRHDAQRPVTRSTAATSASRSWPAWATERVEIVPYDPRWPHRATEHINRLHRLLARWLVRPVEHVGSTAVPGLPAKPIIDLQAAVPDLTATVEITDALHADGWSPVPPELDRRPWRRLYVRPQGDTRAAHLHLLAHDSPRWREQLSFRDALRTDPSLVAAYARLKADLADRHADDREAYTDGKASFVRGVLGPAREADQVPRPPTVGHHRPDHRP